MLASLDCKGLDAGGLLYFIGVINMIRTNKHNLPDRVIKVIEGNNNWPPPSEGVFHVTELQMPPYARRLYIDNVQPNDNAENIRVGRKKKAAYIQDHK